MNYLDPFAPTNTNFGASVPPASPVQASAPPQNAFLDYLGKLNAAQGPGGANGQGSSGMPGSHFQAAPEQKGNSALQGAALKAAGGGMAGLSSL